MRYLSGSAYYLPNCTVRLLVFLQSYSERAQELIAQSYAVRVPAYHPVAVGRLLYSSRKTASADTHCQATGGRPEPSVHQQMTKDPLEQVSLCRGLNRGGRNGRGSGQNWAVKEAERMADWARRGQVLRQHAPNPYPPPFWVNTDLPPVPQAFLSS